MDKKMDTIDVIEQLESGDACILIAKNAAAAEKFAATELANCLHAATGFQLSINEIALSAAPKHYSATGGLSLLLGESLAEMELGAERLDLVQDEVRIESQSASCFCIYGGGTRGTLYAVYELLDLLGCRWYHPYETLIPKLKHLCLPRQFSRKPGFAYRETLWESGRAEPLWACRNRLNGSLHQLKETYGGCQKWEPFVHSFYKIIPPDQYAASHPEYYSFRQGQGHVTAGAQLCLTNPDVLQIATEFVLKKMSEADIRIVDVSQNDCASPCQCQACEELDRRGGSHAASLLHFCNRIAAVTSRTYPDKYVGTLAYTYTKKAPLGLKAHKNVAVRLCNMGPYCVAHSIEKCSKNRPYLELLKEWQLAADNIFVWHYATNFLHPLLFAPFFDSFSEDISFYKQQQVQGVFLQGLDSKGVSFAELHAYAMARCLWDPSRQYMTEVEDFAKAYYGAACASVMELIDLLHEKVRTGCHSFIYTHPHEGIFGREQLQRAAVCLKQAFAAVRGNQKFIERLEMIQIWLNYSRITAVPGLRYVEADWSRASSGSVDKTSASFAVQAAPGSRELFEELRDLMKRHDVTMIREFPRNQQDLAERFGWSLETHEMELLKLDNDWLHAEICPELSGMVCTLVDKTTERDLLQKPAPWILGYPYIAGYVEGIRIGTEELGFRQAYSVNRKLSTSSAVVLDADLRDDLLLRRQMHLAPEGPALYIRTTLFNRGLESVTYKPCNFLIASCGDLADIHFFRQDKNGKFIDLENTAPRKTGAESAQWVNLSNQVEPLGVWGFFNHSLRIGLTLRCTTADAVFCGSNGYEDDQRMLIEMSLPPAQLAAGAEAVHEFEISVIHNNPLKPAVSAIHAQACSAQDQKSEKSRNTM